MYIQSKESRRVIEARPVCVGLEIYDATVRRRVLKTKYFSYKRTAMNDLWSHEYSQPRSDAQHNVKLTIITSRLGPKQRDSGLRHEKCYWPSFKR